MQQLEDKVISSFKSGKDIRIFTIKKKNYVLLEDSNNEEFKEQW